MLIQRFGADDFRGGPWAVWLRSSILLCEAAVRQYTEQNDTTDNDTEFSDAWSMVLGCRIRLAAMASVNSSINDVARPSMTDLTHTYWHGFAAADQRSSPQHAVRQIPSVQLVVRSTAQPDVVDYRVAKRGPGLNVVELEERGSRASSSVFRHERASSLIPKVHRASHRGGNVATALADSRGPRIAACWFPSCEPAAAATPRGVAWRSSASRARASRPRVVGPPRPAGCRALGGAGRAGRRFGCAQRVATTSAAAVNRRLSRGQP
jgi:hypothetical protein